MNYQYIKKIENMKTYTEFQKATKVAWETEGMNESKVHEILLYLGTTFGMTRSPKMIGEAWKIYKSNPETKNKYIINTEMNTQCTVVACCSQIAFEKAMKYGWKPKHELPMLIQAN